MKFPANIRASLNRWHITDADVIRLCRYGFDFMLGDALCECSDVEVNKLYDELERHGHTVSDRAWVARTMLAASFELPHVSWLCAKQTDGQSFLDRLRPLDDEVESAFGRALISILGDEAELFRVAAAALWMPSEYWDFESPTMSPEQFGKLRLTLGRAENFDKLANIACTSSPRTSYGQSRFWLEQEKSAPTEAAGSNRCADELARTLDQTYLDETIRANLQRGLIRARAARSSFLDLRYVAPWCNDAAMPEAHALVV